MSCLERALQELVIAKNAHLGFRQKIAKLEKLVAAQAVMIDKLLAENAILTINKSSGNSSMNPSSDLKPKRKTNLGEKSGKKPCKQ